MPAAPGAKSPRGLLDVNVLIALLDQAHPDARRAHAWLLGADEGNRRSTPEAPRTSAIATCPVTQNGVLRIMSQPSYSQGAEPFSLAAVMRALKLTLQRLDHQFWPDSASLLDETLYAHARIHGPRQLTDIYLLGLAVKHGGTLATVDRNIPLSAVQGAKPSHLTVL